MNLAKEKQLQNFNFLFFGGVCVMFKCCFFFLFHPQPVLVKLKHVFSWHGSPEAALSKQRAGAAEVMAAQVQASSGFRQELESSLFFGGEGLWSAQFSCLCCLFLLRTICGGQCLQPKGGASYRHAWSTLISWGRR